MSILQADCKRPGSCSGRQLQEQRARLNGCENARRHSSRPLALGSSPPLPLCARARAHAADGNRIHSRNADASFESARVCVREDDA